MPPLLPYGRHVIEEDDVAAVVEVLRGDFLTTGPLTPAFDAALAARLDAPHAVGCANGTVALHMAVKALGLGPGDWIVVPAITFLATANCARFEGADVIFADVDPDSGLMRPQDLQAALDKAGARKVRAVFPVHLGGQPCDMAGIAAIARARGLFIVEDACHALGTVIDGVGPVGNCALSDMACFSFHPVKTIAMGEGGAVSTRDPALARRLEDLRCHGMTRDASRFQNLDMALDGEGKPNPWYYEMPELGFNFRLDEIACALGLSQLAKLDRFVARRAELVARYDALLKPLAPLVRPVNRQGGRIGWHLCQVLIDFAAAGRSRAQVMQALRERGVGTQVHYIPVPEQPYYRQLYGRPQLPGATAFYERALSLPLFPGMEVSDADRVVAALAEVLGR